MPDQPSIVVREVSTNPEDVEYELLELIAELDETEIEQLPSLYKQVDHLVEHLFRNPPVPAAQVELTFSYAGYRITIDQTGRVTVVAVKRSETD